MRISYGLNIAIRSLNSLFLQVMITLVPNILNLDTQVRPQSQDEHSDSPDISDICT